MLLNGKPVDTDRLKVLALNNFGHFTSMRVENHRVRGLDLHLGRLVNDCRRVFGADLDRTHLRGLIRQAVGDNGEPMVIRVTIFDPELDLGHPGNDSMPQVLVTTRNAVGGQLPPLTLHAIHYERDIPTVKHVGLFATMFYRRQAQLAGCDDVLFLDRRGLVSEGATWNIAFVQDDRIVWPDSVCLPGVTMELIKELHPGTVGPIDPTNLEDWTGAFITNAAVGVRPVARIDGRYWPETPPLVRSLSQRYAAREGDLI